MLLSCEQILQLSVSFSPQGSIAFVSTGKIIHKVETFAQWLRPAFVISSFLWNCDDRSMFCVKYFVHTCQPVTGHHSTFSMSQWKKAVVFLFFWKIQLTFSLACLQSVINANFWHSFVLWIIQSTLTNIYEAVSQCPFFYIDICPNQANRALNARRFIERC